MNLSVWLSIDDLAAFVYRSGHVDVMRRRREWFERLDVAMALWWIKPGEVPSVEQARGRLDHIERHGPTPVAFTFKERFAAPAV